MSPLLSGSSSTTLIGSFSSKGGGGCLMASSSVSSRSNRVTASSSSKSFPLPRGKATSTTNPMKVFTVFASRKDTPPPFTTKAATKTTRLNAVLEPEQQRQQNNGDNINAEKPLQVVKANARKIRKNEWAALISSCGVTSIAITATYFRLLRSYNLMDDVGGVSVFPTAELFAQLALIAGAAVGMEFYARFAHKYLWHDVWWSMPMKYRKDWNKKIWLLHESHHLPREGAFEANDIFAVANGVPAFVLCSYGFFTPGVYGGLCFGAGLGITLFGIAYMYVHDGMVHKRFPTGPLGKLPWLRRVAAAHTIHHTEQFQGAPWGLFLGEDELSKHPGGIAELDKVCLANDRADKRREMECLAAGFSNAEQCDVPIHLSVGSSKDDYLVVSQDETELGIKAGLHIPSQIESPQCVITEDGKRINESFKSVVSEAKE
ncbi:unnamed protein product [Bathycoccus prasinos]